MWLDAYHKLRDIWEQGGPDAVIDVHVDQVSRPRAHGDPWGSRTRTRCTATRVRVRTQDAAMKELLR